MKKAIHLLFVSVLLAASCTTAPKKDSSETAPPVDNSKYQEADKGLNIDPATVSQSDDCTCLIDWRTCAWKGATQATYNVRPDGFSEFKVWYCCGIPQCNYDKGGQPTTPGSVKHQEFLVDYKCGCLKLVNQQFF